MSKVFGTDKTNASLGEQTDLLTSIDGSLRAISGKGTSSGTGLSFDTGLGGVFGSGGGSISSGGGGSGSVVVNGVARSRATQQKPSTMDYVTAIGGSMLKSFAINQAVGMASTALFGATPMALLGNAYSGLQLGMAGFTPATFVGPLAPGALTGMELGASFAGASSTAGGVAGTAAAAEGLGSAAVAAEAGTAAAAGSGIGAGLATAMPYIAAAVAVYLIIDSYGGGGGSAPPPKEPKYHAAMYVAGNNDINAIAPIYQTVDYHAPPDVYKTIAYGLLRVAFNATKSAEQVTQVTTLPYDYLYIKVEFNRIALCWGKGSPSASSLAETDTNVVGSWGAPSEGTNLNAIAKDIVNLVTAEFKKAGADAQKLDTAAKGLLSYSLDDLSSGLISDLKSGQYKLNNKVAKGVFADDVAESNRIGELISAASTNKAYVSEATADTYEFDPNDTDYRNGADRKLVKGSPGGVAMVYSLKEGKFIESTFPGAILIDTAGRPVYDIEGTSTGLTVEDFASASVVGANRQANILVDTPASTAGGAGSTVVTTVTGPTVDNSAITNYYNQLSTVVDSIRGPTPQVG
jgi:hypothetical protein